MPTRLFVADTHLTDKPQDEYRWALFPALRAWVEKYEVEEVWILGDVTDSKEGHRFEFVNRLVNEIELLSELTNVYILRGNHDFLLEHTAFFEFLDKLTNVRWIDAVTAINGVLCFPYSKNPKRDWESHIGSIDEYDFAVFHQCFVGSKSSLGHVLEGTDLDLTNLSNCTALAGDIHLPQKVRGIEYVGSPYPTTFGDRFLGRCLLYREGRERLQLHLQTIQKCTLVIAHVNELYDAHIYPDDQIKVRYQLSKEDRAQWTNIKQAIKVACKDLGVVLGGIELLTDTASKTLVEDARVIIKKTSDDSVLKQFAEKEDLPTDFLDAGLLILGDV